MEEAKPPEQTPLVTITSAVDQHSLTFYRFDKLLEWMQLEYGAWEWARTTGGRDGNLSGLAGHWKQLSRAINEATALVSRTTQSSGLDPSVAPEFAAIKARLEQQYTQKALLSTSVLGRQIIDMSKQDDIAAAYTLLNVLGQESGSQSAKAMKGNLYAVLFRENLISAEPAARTALDALQGEFRQEIDTAATVSANSKSRAEETNRKSIELLNSARKILDEHIALHSKATEEQLAGIKKDAADLKRTLLAELSLRGAVKYWNDKARTHRNFSWIWGVASLVIGSALAGTAIVFLPKILTVTVPVNGSQQLTMLQVPLSNLTLVFILATLGFWLLRILVRFTLSNVHLATDARIRATMMTTYLALLKRGAGELDAKDRQLILSVLFRPSITGIVKDDGVPPGLLDVFTRGLSR